MEKKVVEALTELVKYMDTAPRCLVCGEERYPQDPHCMGCGEEWDCDFELQQKVPAPPEVDWGAEYEAENRNGQPKPR